MPKWHDKKDQISTLFMTFLPRELHVSSYLKGSKYKRIQRDWFGLIRDYRSQPLQGNYSSLTDSTSLPCTCGYLAMRSKIHCRVVAVVSVPAPNRLVTENTKFLSLKWVSLMPDSWYKEQPSHHACKLILPRICVNVSDVYQTAESHLFPLLPNQKTVYKSSAYIRVQGLFQLLHDDHVIHYRIFSIFNQMFPVFDPPEQSGEHVVQLFGREQKRLFKKLI